MSACAQCGTVPKPTDKFCNVCGTPLAQPGLGPGAPQGGGGYAPAPAQPQGYAPAAPGGAFGAAPAPGYAPPQPSPGARCQMGHEVAPGASYCAQGHPVAADPMQYGGDPYGGGAGAFGAPPPPPAPPPQAFAPPPPAPAPFGAPPPAGPPFGAQPGFPGPSFGAPAPNAPPQPAFGSQPAPGYAQPQQAYAPAQAPQPGFGAPPPPAPGFGAPAAPPAYGASDTSRDAAPPKVLRGFLVAYGTNPSGEFWPLTGGRLTVGRLGAADGIDISLQDPTISSRHAALVVDAAAATITVEDTSSTNGTFVNDEHVGFNGRRELRDGDRLRFGGYTTIVKVIGR